ncbi:DNA polymerase II large subunit [Candidatus Micrarchaeota archaeon]|nr:DNA polymerase II large subunit [Candidatus Micrarchaeota archaeon]
MNVSDSYRRYFDGMQTQTQAAYDLAQRAREQGLDPSRNVEIPLAQDVSARVEGLVGPKGIAEVIRGLGSDRETACFQVAADILNGKFGGETQQERVEQAVRTGLALFTEGVVSAPIEGISKVTIEQNPDASKYVAVYFAGPIRGAGGTGQAFALILADFCRNHFKLAEYRPTDDQVERYVEEVNLYAIRTRAGQYVPTEDEVRHVVQSCPVCIHGEPTEQYEVNTYRNISGVQTNRVRSGVCLVIGEGICLKAAKILKITGKHELNWTWVERLIKVAKKTETTEIKPVSKYMDDIVAGRPIFSFPMKVGGFRLRYGRTRFTGIQSKAIHPACMEILDAFPAFGTQVKTERPGKGCVVTPCETIEGPTVLLENGEVRVLNSAQEALSVKSRVKKILYLGDMLVCFGDFLKSNHALVPGAFVDEEYQLMLEAQGIQTTVAELSTLSFAQALELSKKTGLPLAPKHSFYWQSLSTEQAKTLRDWIKKKGKLVKEWFDVKYAGITDAEHKNLLEDLGVPHKWQGGEIVFDADVASSLWMQLGVMKPAEPDVNRPVIQYVNKLSDVPVRDKAGLFLGTSMGRPEKSRERKMQPPVHVLFPVGLLGGKMRDIMKAQHKSGELDLQIRYCTACHRKTWQTTCPQCKNPVPAVRQCLTCGQYTAKTTCACGGNTTGHSRQRLAFDDAIGSATKTVQYKPDQLKGVIGLISADKTPEQLAKGVLRAKYGLSVFRDGTCRVDATEVPITHFVPRETGLNVSQCKKLGYKSDIHGKPLERDDQTLELFAQDVILSEASADYLLKIAQFIDDELVYLYGKTPYYRALQPKDLVGHQVICIAPHTSAGITARIIGFSQVHAILAHPYIHCACRRNADGDELGFLLLMDGLLNFSKAFLPETRGGRMDAPLVLTTQLNPLEVDDEVHAMDRAPKYPLELYDAARNMANPSEVHVDLIKDHLGDASALEGIAYTHEAAMSGPYQSTYVKFKNMQHKVQDELQLMQRIAAVDAAAAAERIILNHFLPDLYGNLRSFSRQTFRCVDCTAKYRRVPLVGKCRQCGGKLLLTINKGGIEKYLQLSKKMAEDYNLPNYLKQRLALIEKEIKSIFHDEKVQQFSLNEYL